MKTPFYLALTITLTIVTFSCNGKYHRAIENKGELIKLSQYQSTTNDNDRKYYELITYTPDYKLENHFIFQKLEKENRTFYALSYDSIQFYTDNVIGLDLRDDQYATHVCDYYMKVSELLKPYKIKSLIGKRPQFKLNPELTIYFEREGRLKYYPKETIDEIFKEKYLGDHKEIEKDWYFTY